MSEYATVLTSTLWLKCVDLIAFCLLTVLCVSSCDTKLWKVKLVCVMSASAGRDRCVSHSRLPATSVW